MKKKLFGTIFGYRETQNTPSEIGAIDKISPPSKSASIKPAHDILDFEYPPESPFYQQALDAQSDKAAEFPLDS